MNEAGFAKDSDGFYSSPTEGRLVWEIKTKVYVPSMLFHRGHLFGVQDNGIAFCRKADSGDEVWSARLEGGFTASPVLVGDLIFAVSDSGRTSIFEASPAAFKLIATNALGGETMATPAICGGRIYLRTAVPQGGRRQEMLICVGRP